MPYREHAEELAKLLVEARRIIKSNMSPVLFREFDRKAEKTLKAYRAVSKQPKPKLEVLPPAAIARIADTPPTGPSAEDSLATN